MKLTETDLARKLDGVQKQIKFTMKSLRKFRNNEFKVSEIMMELGAIVPELKSWLQSYISCELNSSSPATTCFHGSALNDPVTDCLDALCSKLSWSDEWVVWSRGKNGITIIQVIATVVGLTIENTVRMEFQREGEQQHSDLVSFYCTSSMFGVKLRFQVRAEDFVDHTRALLKSFQFSRVVTPKIENDFSVDTSAENLPRKSEQMYESFDNPVPVKVEKESIEDVNEVEDSYVEDDAIDEEMEEGLESRSRSPNVEANGDVGATKDDFALIGVERNESGKRKTNNQETIIIKTVKDCDSDVLRAIECKPKMRKEAKTNATSGQAKKKKKKKKRNEDAPKKPRHKTLQPCRFCAVDIPFEQASNHMLTIHGSDNAGCCYCPKSFASIEHRDNHHETYHRKNWWAASWSSSLKCKVCEVSLIRRVAFDHMQAEHDREGEWPFCGYLTKPLMEKRGDTSKMGIEEAVDFGNASTPGELLIRHIKRTHHFKPKAPGRAWCKHCKGHFKDLEKHQRLDEGSELPACVKNPHLKMCNLCGATPSNLRKHQATNHGIDVECLKKYKCTFCPLAYSNAYRLKIHLRQHHLIDQKIPCPKCTSAFATQREVDKHMLKHEPPKLKCPECDKMFRWRENVLQHMQGCHFPPQYECLSCHGKFHFRNKLRNHLKLAHDLIDNDQTYVKHKTLMDPAITKIGPVNY